MTYLLIPAESTLSRRPFHFNVPYCSSAAIPSVISGLILPRSHVATAAWHLPMIEFSCVIWAATMV